VLVDEVRLERRGEGRELSGRISFETSGLEPQRLWFRSPVPPGELDASPFLAALLMRSMHLGEPLHIDGTVSPLLLENARRASLLLRSWWPELTEASVSVAETAPGGGGTATGVFFTRGADSWHSVLETLAEEPGEVRLLGWPGADLQVYEAQSPRQAAERENESADALREAAELVGAPLDMLESNMRTVVDPDAPWPVSHGGQLGALAIAHGGVAEARIAGALPLGNLVPMGTHPLLDPLWSTEGTRIVHHAAETSRMEKLASLAHRPEVLARLRVCDFVQPGHNCGTCGKCVRTMVGLELAGVLDAVPFDAPLSRERIRRLSVSTSIDRAFGEELLGACSRNRRFDLSDPLQIAIVEDYVRRASKRGWVVARHWLRRRIGRILSRA
jgi:hypothetical protein